MTYLLFLSGLGLFEAMTALEMMDPKMDSGMRCNKSKTPPLTYETALASGKLKLDNFTIPEIIGIMDSMLACTVSWLEGHSLPQTIYTCLYMHNINAIEDQSLKAFFFGMNNVMRIVKDIILAAAVYEEEDFQPIVFPLPLEECTHDVVYALLKQAEDRLIKTTKSATDDHAELMQAVINRLKFLRFFMDTLNAFNEAKVDIDIKIVKQLNILSELLGSIKRTLDKGTPKEPDCKSHSMSFYLPQLFTIISILFSRCSESNGLFAACQSANVGSHFSAVHNYQGPGSKCRVFRRTCSPIETGLQGYCVHKLPQRTGEKQNSIIITSTNHFSNSASSIVSTFTELLHGIQS